MRRDRKAGDEKAEEHEIGLKDHELGDADHLIGRDRGDARSQPSREGSHDPLRPQPQVSPYDHCDRGKEGEEHEEVDEHEAPESPLQDIPKQRPTVGRKGAARVFLVPFLSFEPAGYEAFAFSVCHVFTPFS